jgi:hypothetical protein
MIPQYSPSYDDSAMRNPLVLLIHLYIYIYIDGCRTGVRGNGAIVGPTGPKNEVDNVKVVTVNA